MWGAVIDIFQWSGFRVTGFDIDKILEVTFGQFIGDPNNIAEVHVRFNKRVAPLVMSRQFSAAEQKKVLPGGDNPAFCSSRVSGNWCARRLHNRGWMEYARPAKYRGIGHLRPARAAIDFAVRESYRVSPATAAPMRGASSTPSSA